MFRHLAEDMRKGHNSFSSWLSLGAHTATHIDSPAHFLADQYEAGNTVDKIPLRHLMGRALVVGVPFGRNITADVLASLDIPDDCERLLFKTDNTARNLMRTKAFHSDYTALTPDGAQWLVDHTAVTLVGIDYLSIATYDQNKEGHLVLFTKQPEAVTVVEGLDMTYLRPGRWYDLTCLPLRITGADGAPARCVAVGPDAQYEQWRREQAAAEGAAAGDQAELEDVAEALAAEHGDEL